MEKTIGELVDELSVVNIKIFYLVEKLEEKKITLEETYKMNDLNHQRSVLKNAINKFFKQREEIKVEE